MDVYLKKAKVRRLRRDAEHSWTPGMPKINVKTDTNWIKNNQPKDKKKSSRMSQMRNTMSNQLNSFRVGIHSSRRRLNATSQLGSLRRLGRGSHTKNMSLSNVRSMKNLDGPTINRNQFLSPNRNQQVMTSRKIGSKRYHEYKKPLIPKVQKKPKKKKKERYPIFDVLKKRNHARRLTRNFKRRKGQVLLEPIKSKIGEWLGKIEIKFSNYFFKRDIVNCINCLAPIMLLCVELNMMKTIFKLFFFMVASLECFGQNDLAFGVYQQMLQLCDNTDNNRNKLLIFLRIADICLKSRYIEQGLHMLMKCIELSWLLNDDKIELKIYDKMGYCYYLKGDIPRAQYFHYKSIHSNFEDNELLARKTCIDNLKDNEELELSKKKNLDGNITYNSLHILGFSPPFMNQVEKLAETDDEMENRLEFFTSKKSQEYTSMYHKLITGNLYSFNINFSTETDPVVILYKSDNLNRTVTEFLALPRNTVLYHPPNIGRETQEKFVKNYRKYKRHANRVNKYTSPASLIYQEKKKKKHNELGLHSVHFYTKVIDTDEYIKNIGNSIANKLIENSQVSFIPHLSPNRTLSEFRPFFDPKINIPSFFKKLHKGFGKRIDEVLSSAVCALPGLDMGNKVIKAGIRRFADEEVEEKDVNDLSSSESSSSHSSH